MTRPRFSVSDRMLLLKLLRHLVEQETEGGRRHWENGRWTDDPVDWEMVAHAYDIAKSLGSEAKGRRETIDPAYLGFETHQLGIRDPVGEISAIIKRLEGMEPIESNEARI